MLQRVPKISSSRNFEKCVLTGVGGAQFTGCSATKRKLLTNFLEGLLKIMENSKEELGNGVPFQSDAGVQTTACRFMSF